MKISWTSVSSIVPIYTTSKEIKIGKGHLSIYTYESTNITKQIGIIKHYSPNIEQHYKMLGQGLILNLFSFVWDITWYNKLKIHMPKIPTHYRRDNK